MYEQQNNAAYLQYLQKKQLTVTLAAMFVVVIAAIAFSAFLVNMLVKQQVADALAMQTRYMQSVTPTGSFTEASAAECEGSNTVESAAVGGSGAGEEAGAVLSAVHTPLLPVGGSGAGGSGAGGESKARVTNNNTTNHHSNNTSYVNSGNVIGSNNGSGNTVNNTNKNIVKDSYNQGSYNTAGDDLKQYGFYKNGSYVNQENDAEFKPETVFSIEKSFDDSGNTEDNDKTINKTEDNDTTVTTTTTLTPVAAS